MTALPSGPCGICHRPLAEQVSGERRVVKTACNHLAHRSCFFDEEALRKITKVQARVFCFDQGCEKAKDPKFLYRGKKETWQQEIIVKRKVEVIEMGAAITPPAEAPPIAPPVVPPEAPPEAAADLRPFIYTINVSVIAITAICAFAAFQTYVATLLAMGVGAVGSYFIGRHVEQYILAPSS
ncbi:MAG: hypothetical protein S4CHLAM37_12530 [Chlamydiia bacterium]|nr:hypothetical protein [Chlamydiia bacterium]